MRAASSGLLVPAIGFADGEGAGDAAGTEGAEWTGSGEEELAVVVTGVLGDLLEAAAEDTTMAGTTGEPENTKAFEQLCLRLLVHLDCEAAENCKQHGFSHLTW